VQHYGGPVVVVVDANTYSSGDLFTAGIVDNSIGPVLCVGTATGAGGANVWECDDLRVALNAAGHPLPRLPKRVGFTMAVRRAVRTGSSEGSLIEDAGIPGQSYEMTERDLFYGNHDLIERCGELLAQQPWTRMHVRHSGSTVTIDTAGLDQIDIYADGHPAAPPVTIRSDGQRRLQVPPGATEMELVGLAGNVVRQRRRIQLTR